MSPEERQDHRQHLLHPGVRADSRESVPSLKRSARPSPGVLEGAQCNALPPKEGLRLRRGGVLLLVALLFVALKLTLESREGAVALLRSQREPQAVLHASRTKKTTKHVGAAAVDVADVDSTDLNEADEVHLAVAAAAAAPLEAAAVPTMPREEGIAMSGGGKIEAASANDERNVVRLVHHVEPVADKWQSSQAAARTGSTGAEMVVIHRGGNGVGGGGGEGRGSLASRRLGQSAESGAADGDSLGREGEGRSYSTEGIAGREGEREGEGEEEGGGDEPWQANEAAAGGSDEAGAGEGGLLVEGREAEDELEGEDGALAAAGGGDRAAGASGGGGGGGGGARAEAGARGGGGGGGGADKERGAGVWRGRGEGQKRTAVGSRQEGLRQQQQKQTQQHSQQQQQQQQKKALRRKRAAKKGGREKRKYLYYGARIDAPLADTCAGLNHQTSSLRCAMEEAYLLNSCCRCCRCSSSPCCRRSTCRRPRSRHPHLMTLVIPEYMCMADKHNIPIFHRKDRPAGSIRLRTMYDVAGMRAQIPRGVLSVGSRRWKLVVRNFRRVKAYENATWHELRDRPHFRDARVIHRVMSNYWHRLCWTRFGRKRRVVLPSPPFAAPLRQAAAQMADQMGPFDFIHVRRGDKLRITADGKLMWPHLDRDTRPHNIHRRIRRWVPDGSSIYIASNEPQGGFFSPLEKWYNVWSSEDFEVALEGTVRNNYHLFAIELMLAEYSRKFIGTFKGESPHKYYLSVDPREGYHRS